MAYIGTSPTQAVRTRFLYTATASQTTFSGADTQNLTLRYSDANFVDVYQNGVLLKGGGADYTATTTTSVVLATGATADDVIEIIVYDVFAVANLIKKDGDTVEGVINFNGKEITLDADFDTSITSDTDDQIDFRAGGTDVMAMSTTGLTITNASNDAQLTLTSTDADASEGPKLDLYRNSASPADSDAVGRVVFSGENDADEKVDLVRIIGILSDASDGSEDGTLQYYVTKDGTRINRLTHTPTETVINDDSKDVDFRVESDVNANTLFIEGSTGNVGIGTNSVNVSANDTTAFTTLSIIETIGNRSGILEIGDNQDQETGGIGSINFVGHYQDTNHKIMAQIKSASDGGTSGQRGANIKIFTKENGSTTLTERVRVHSGGVVSFNNGIELGSGVDATAANTLDDYEEGTWTPTLSGSSSGSGTLSSVSARYTKVGRIVHCEFTFVVNSVGSISGNAIIGGFPFSGGFFGGQGAVRNQGFGGDNTDGIVFEMLLSRTTGRFHFNSSTSTQRTVLTSDVSNGDFVAASISYST